MDQQMESAWNQTRVSLKFALNHGCFAPVHNRIPFNDHELRNVAYGECKQAVQEELNLRTTQPNQTAIYQRREVHGTVHDVEQVGLMLTGWMRDGGIVHTVMRCLNEEQWEVTISRNKPLEVESE